MSQDDTHEARESARTKDRPFSSSMPRGCFTVSSWALMASYLGIRQLSFDTARQNGWYPSWDAGDANPRIVIPATATGGNLYWQARLMEKKDGRSESSVHLLDNTHIAPPPIRYMSPFAPRGDAIVVVWPLPAPLPRANRRNTVIIAEGPMDALAAAGHGFMGVALMGLRPPEQSLDLTAKLFRDKMCGLVADSNGQEAMSAILIWLSSRGIACKLILVQPYDDLADIPNLARGRYLKDMYPLVENANNADVSGYTAS